MIRMRVRSQTVCAAHDRATCLFSKGYGARHGNAHHILGGHADRVAPNILNPDVLSTRWKWRAGKTRDAFISDILAEAAHPRVAPDAPPELTTFLDALQDARLGLATRFVESPVPIAHMLLQQLFHEATGQRHSGATRTHGAVNVGESYFTEPWRNFGPSAHHGWQTIDHHDRLNHWTTEGRLVSSAPAPWHGRMECSEIAKEGVLVLTDAEIYLAEAATVSRWPRSVLPAEAFSHVVPLGENWWAGENEDGWHLVHGANITHTVRGHTRHAGLTEGCVILAHVTEGVLRVQTFVSGGVRVIDIHDSATPARLECDGTVLAAHTTQGWELHPLDAGPSLRPKLGCSDPGEPFLGAHKHVVYEQNAIAVGRQGRWCFDADADRGGLAVAAYQQRTWTFATLAEREPRAAGRLRHAAVTEDAFWFTTRARDGLRTLCWSDAGVMPLLPMQHMMSMVFGVDERHVLLMNPAGVRALACVRGWTRLPSDRVWPLIAPASPRASAVIYEEIDRQHSLRLLPSDRVQRVRWRAWPTPKSPSDDQICARAHGITWFMREGTLHQQMPGMLNALVDFQIPRRGAWKDQHVSTNGDVSIQHDMNSTWLLRRGGEFLAVEVPSNALRVVTNHGPCVVWRDALWSIDDEGRARRVADTSVAWPVVPRDSETPDGVLFVGNATSEPVPPQQSLFERRASISGAHRLHWWHADGERSWAAEHAPSAEHTRVLEVAGGLVMWSYDADFGGAWWFPFDGEPPRKLVAGRVRGCVPTGSGFAMLTTKSLLRFGAGAVLDTERHIQSGCVARYGSHAWVGWDGWGEPWLDGQPCAAVWCGEDVPPTHLLGTVSAWRATWADDNEEHMSVGVGDAAVFTEATCTFPVRTVYAKLEHPPMGTRRLARTAPTRVDLTPFQQAMTQVLRGEAPLADVQLTHPGACQALISRALELQNAHIAARNDRGRTLRLAPDSLDSAMLAAWAASRRFSSVGKHGAEHWRRLRAAADVCFKPNGGGAVALARANLWNLRDSDEAPDQRERLDSAISAMDALHQAHANLCARDGAWEGPIALFWWMAVNGASRY